MSLFFAFFTTALSYNIYRSDCVAVLDAYKYDLTRFTGQDAFIPSTDYATYYIRLCPDPTMTGSTMDVFVMQCPKKAGSLCRNIITQNSLDYKPRNAKNFSNGIIYYADSEPFSDDNGRTFRTLDIEFDLECDPSVTTNDTVELFKQWKFTIDDTSRAGFITVRGSHESACPTIVPSPTPTPPYEPDCTYIDRIDTNTSFGISGDLKNLNDGPFGVRAPLKIADTDYVLYYQACERMLCPPTYTCGTSGYSSAWLCQINGSTRFCTSYGVGTEDVDFVPIDSSQLELGMKLKMSDRKTGKSVELTLTCATSEAYPEGHIDWPDTATIFEGKTLEMRGGASEMCFKPIPTTTPQPDSVCHFKTSMSNRTVDFDLEDLNLGSTGWEKPVQIVGDRDHPDSHLIYQPCGSMICPADTYCAGDEDAAIWLCYTDDGIKQCRGYGLYKNNVSLSLYIPSTIDSGVQAKYTGDLKRAGDVIFSCDPSIPKHQLELPETVTLSGRTLSIFIKTSDVCSTSIKPDDQNKAKISPGAYFLIILAIVVVLYLSIGVLVQYFMKGIVRVPNYEFWGQVGACISAAFSFIFSCGKTTEIALESKYDKI
ncbi:hypothetical protein TRFO_09348 [Tritrichomonas foetus]|uniref:MRH domain-containing protein n=1 Tax=Tritrichomonas foetus TaxID=1144522 RepID=A0A1J4JEV6_9EUKA|nr:hypothetical protein TRFO_09348 [Tritrichomonas foetus]|eukprot:OHS97640.1 hypothetical protein TRFO_09348 [Tritrichomonas foetus]